MDGKTDSMDSSGTSAGMGAPGSGSGPNPRGEAGSGKTTSGSPASK
jgi:hypothetical protein